MSSNSIQDRPYRCPVCRTEIWSFVPCGQNISHEHQASIVSNGARHGCRCPTCGSRERHRLLWLFLQLRSLLDDGPLRILHFAPNRGLYDRFRDDPRVHWILVDIRRPESDLFVDIQQLPFESNAFDIVICSHVLEHVKDDGRALAELRRVLSATGYALLLVPLDWSQTTVDAADETAATRRKRFGQADHFRLYGRDIEAHFDRAGLDVETSSFQSTLTAAERFRYGLNDAEPFFVCRPGVSRSSG